MKRFRLLPLIILLLAYLPAQSENVNAITLLEQQDRDIECKVTTSVSSSKGKSKTTGMSSKENYNPVLVELNNENGGVYVTAPIGILEADFIYEFQTRTDGTMGMVALFQDNLPTKVGPVGNASVGGVVLQSEWDCGYVYNDIPTDSDGTISELGYSISNWFNSYSLIQGSDLFPANVSSVKEWKKYFNKDSSMITSENYFLNISGIKSILEKNNHKAKEPLLLFLKDKDVEVSDIPVKEIDIRSSSKTFSSGFIYDEEDKLYRRWVGVNNQYGDTNANEQLSVSNVIIQRVDYTTSNKNMAPITIGKGNADIFILGSYLEGYWVRETAADKTTYYDSDGNPLNLLPGTTFVSLLSNSTSVVILNY